MGEPLPRWRDEFREHQCCRVRVIGFGDVGELAELDEALDDPQLRLHVELAPLADGRGQHELLMRLKTLP